MKKFATLLLSSVIAASLLGGCSGKDGDPGPAGTAGTNGTQGPVGPAGPSGQNLTGTMFGFVNPVDEYGNALPRNGVVVTLDGVTPAVTATSNADGRYEFTALRNGTYNLTFSRTGLSTFRRIGLGHVGGDQPTFLNTTTLSAPSTTTLGNLVVTSQTATTVTINQPFSNAGAPAGSFIRIGVYASATPGVTAATGTLLNTVSTASSPLLFGVSKTTLNSAGFASGTAVYLVTYGLPTSLPSYTDPATGKIVYAGLSAASSNQVAFIVP